MAAYPDDPAPRRPRYRDDPDPRDYDEGYDRHAKPPREPRYDPEPRERRQRSRRDTYDASDDEDTASRRPEARDDDLTSHPRSRHAEEAAIPPPPIGEDRDGADDYDNKRRSNRRDRYNEKRSPSDESGGRYRAAPARKMPTASSLSRDQDRDQDQDQDQDRDRNRNRDRDRDRNRAHNQDRDRDRERHVDHSNRERDAPPPYRRDTILDEPDPESLPYRPREKRSPRERRNDDVGVAPPSPRRRRDAPDPRRSLKIDDPYDDDRRQHRPHRTRYHDDESEYEAPPRRKYVDRPRDRQDDRAYLSDAPRRRDRDDSDSRGYRTDGRDSRRDNDRRRPERDTSDRYHDRRGHDSRRDHDRSGRKGGDMNKLMENGQKTWQKVEPVAKPLLAALAKKYLDGAR